VSLPATYQVSREWDRGAVDEHLLGGLKVLLATLENRMHSVKVNRMRDARQNFQIA
jgi:hypothetical protein